MLKIKRFRFKTDAKNGEINITESSLINIYKKKLI